MSLGWNYRTIDEHTLIEVIELLQYVNEHPTAAEILAVVHGVKVTTASSIRKNMPDEKEFEEGFWAPEMQMFGMPEHIDPDLQESLNFVKDKLKVN